MFRLICCLFAILVSVVRIDAQTTLQSDEHADVVDYSSIDSLWRESVDRGRLRTAAVGSDVYRRFRDQCANATPMAYLPNARLAFWTNVYVVCLMEAMHLRVGYRSTTHDSLWLRRDTFLIARERVTLDDMLRRVEACSVLVHARECLPTGSSHGAPLPPTLATTRRVHVWYRDMLRRIVRSERNLLFDPWSSTLQVSAWLRPLWIRLGERDGTFVDYVMPQLTESIAAQIAMCAPQLRIVFSDRIETWRKARPR